MSNALIFEELRIWSQNYAIVCKLLTNFNEAFIPYNELQLGSPSIVVHSPARLTYIAYGLVMLV